MLKYAVEHIKGDNETILGIFDTREEAKEAGERERKNIADGKICVISANFTEEGERADGRCKVFEIW